MKGSCSAARKHGKCTTCEGEGGGGDGVHIDGCCRWDAGGHEAGVGGTGVLEWGLGAGGAGGGGEHKHDRVDSSGYYGGDGVSWQVNGGVMDEDGAMGGATGS